MNNTKEIPNIKNTKKKILTHAKNKEIQKNTKEILHKKY